MNRHRIVVVAAVASALAMLPLAPVTRTYAWTVPAAVAIALVAFTGWTMRQVPAVPKVLVPPAQAIVVVVWLGVLVAADAAFLGVVPTTDWARRLADVLTEGIASVQRYASPVPVEDGILLLIVGGAGLVAITVDLLAVGLRRVPLSGIALGAVYAVSAAVVSDGLPWFWFVPPAVGFLALLVAEGRTRVGLWGRSAGPAAGRSRLPETGSLARSGRRVGAVAVVAAIAVPALLPGLTDGVLSGGFGSGGGGGRTIRTDNPIVDLKRDLVRPDNVPVLSFTTEDRPTYVRTTVLDLFDGERWEPSDRPVPPSQRVSEGLPSPPGLSVADSSRVSYTFRVSEYYESEWLPLRYPAQTIDIDGDWRYDVQTLDVVAAEGSAANATYSATSLAVHPDAEQLRQAPPPSDDLAAMTELPEDLPEAIGALATDVVGNADSHFDMAAALQRWFRSDGGFVYSLETDEGSSSDHLLAFLDAETGRRGYCEQFAAAMAVMARSLGIPARVAVGFLGAEQEGEVWVMTAHDRHAWVELYFEGTGWVPFEPTPARRTGSAPNWTLQPIDNPDAPGANPGAPQPSTSVAGQANIPGLEDPSLAGGGASGSIDQTSPWPVVTLGAAALVVLCVLPATAGHALRARRWRRAGDDVVGQAESAWSDLRDTLRDSQLSWTAGATPRIIGELVKNSLHLDAGTTARLDRLVHTTERARYSATPPDVAGLRHDVAAVRRSLLASRKPGQRLRAFVWPATLTTAGARLGERLGAQLDRLDLATRRLRRSSGTQERLSP